MDIYYYTAKFHDFLDKQGLLRYLVSGDRAYGLKWCLNRVRNAIENENVRRRPLEPVYVIGQEAPIDYVLNPDKEIKPEELFEVVIWGNGELMERFRGLYVDFSSINNEWKELVSGVEPRQKTTFKSIW